MAARPWWHVLQMASPGRAGSGPCQPPSTSFPSSPLKCRLDRPARLTWSISVCTSSTSWPTRSFFSSSFNFTNTPSLLLATSGLPLPRVPFFFCARRRWWEWGHAHMMGTKCCT